MLFLLAVAVPAAADRRGQKNNPTSLEPLQEKPYIDAGDPHVKNKLILPLLYCRRASERENKCSVYGWFVYSYHSGFGV